MNSVLTSFIKETVIDHAALSDRFEVACLSYQSLSANERNAQLPHMPTRIYRSARVLALLQDWKHSQYWVLLPKGITPNLKDDSLSVRKEALDSLHDWILRALLIRAMPRLLNLEKDKQQRVEADGLYYVTKYKRFESDGSIITTANVDPQKCPATGMWRLIFKTSTFTPLKMHGDKNGRLASTIARMPRYELDTLNQEVKRSSDGQYVKRALWRKHKNRVSAIKLSGAITLESYYQTRLGVLSMFLEDIRLAYGDAFSIELDSVQPSARKQIPERLVKKSYTELNELIKQQPIWIINYSHDRNSTAQLEAELRRMGVHSVPANDIKPDGLNILVVNDKENYQDGEPDPYKVARKNHPDAVIQSCYPERLIEKANKHVVEVLVKELFLKSEIQQRKLMLDYPPLPGDAWFITSIRPKDNPTNPRIRWPMFFCRIKDQNLEFGELPEHMVEEIHANLTQQQQRSVFQGFDRADIVFWPDSGDAFIVTDTGAVCLPNEREIHTLVKEIDQAIGDGVPTDLVMHYCAQHPDSPILDQLTDIASGYSSTIPASAFKKLKYRGQANKHFFNNLAENGYRLKASLQSKDAGPLSSTSGLWIDEARRLYAAGDIGSARRDQENFNHIYHVDTNGIPVPDWFWRSLEVWHIRHKGTTVFPYIFKHLREYGERRVLAKL
ncbi:hypothetical protein [Marinobacter orientalis]|uniref:Uncharacterized protein n=1 Tax=Marinobacter orientalis TaxID=1928859 RepID=A0A7Y0RC25_9GAMM|nr:hypothetical protein [Marinobacter orientalis]NMT63479.1 hypothetical protein [Marinobacter orientalis]TGX48540.1 hypothetical protein DIT72_14195 [Marinobacter orientalis]